MLFSVPATIESGFAVIIAVLELALHMEIPISRHLMDINLISWDNVDTY